MADSWIRLDTRAAFGGWTSKLPAEQYAAWIKLLQTVKAFGQRGGRIQTSFLDDEFLAMLRLTRHAFDQMISFGHKKGKIQLTSDGYIIVTGWDTYQLDPTNASRQDRFRKKPVTEVTVTTVSNVSNDDGTGRDGTGRDGTGQQLVPVISGSPSTKDPPVVPVKPVPGDVAPPSTGAPNKERWLSRVTRILADAFKMSPDEFKLQWPALRARALQLWDEEPERDKAVVEALALAESKYAARVCPDNPKGLRSPLKAWERDMTRLYGKPTEAA